MIGFYNVSVILTYVALVSSVCGIFAATSGNIQAALGFLIFSGVCDLFDGKIARATTRTEDERVFGIQIDSLCDLVGFGVLPAVICRSAGATGILNDACLVIFVLAAVIRLGYFNVTEQNRQRKTDELRKYYQGLPVTAISVLLPLIFLFYGVLGAAFPAVLAVFMFATAVLFVLNIKVRKPHI